MLVVCLVGTSICVFYSVSCTPSLPRNNLPCIIYFTFNSSWLIGTPLLDVVSPHVISIIMQHLNTRDCSCPIAPYFVFVHYSSFIQFSTMHIYLQNIIVTLWNRGKIRWIFFPYVYLRFTDNIHLIPCFKIFVIYTF